MSTDSTGRCGDCTGGPDGLPHAPTCPALRGVTPGAEALREPFLVALGLARASARGPVDAAEAAQSLAALVQGQEFTVALERLSVVVDALSGWLGEALRAVSEHGGNPGDLVIEWTRRVEPHRPDTGEAP